MKKLCTLLLVMPLLFVFSVAQIEAVTIKYTCPMHPHYISKHEGDCPICGMDLVPLEVEESGLEQHDHSQDITFSPQLVQRTGYRSEAVEEAFFGRAIRSFGEVVANKRLQSDVSLRVEGWVEELVVDAPGDLVSKGDVLFKVYSPQLISAQQDYLSALKGGNRGRIQISKDRLHSLGMQGAAVQGLSHTRKVLRKVPFYSPMAGSIENLNIRVGSYLKPGALALRIQNYKTVWVRVNIAEQDIPFVHQESNVAVGIPGAGLYFDNVPIDYISPIVDPATRTAELRLLLENRAEDIRPGTYADVEISVDAKPRLSVAYESILQNKAGTYVVLELGGGTFKSQKVTLGIANKGRTEVLSGLQGGDKVVTSGQFLIDSESSLRESFKKMEKLSESLESLALTKEQMVLINHVVEAALYVHEEIVSNKFPKPSVLVAGQKATLKLQKQLDETALSYILVDAAKIFESTAKQLTLSDWRKFLEKLAAALKPWVLEGRADYYKDLGLKAFEDQKGRFWLQFSLPGVSPFDAAEFSEVSLGVSSD